MRLYRLCTISCLTISVELLQIVDRMQNRIPIILSGAILIVGLHSSAANAEDKIQAFVNSYGKVVFTNLVDNAPPAPTPISSQTTDIPGQMPPWLNTMVNTISANHGVDPALVRAVMKTESNFNRWAVSNKGALGLMQLIPSTGRRYGVRDFFDPQQNIDGGVRYLKFLLQKFNGNLDLSLAAYNAGENLVERLGRIPPIAETTTYVQRVRAIYKNKFAPTVVSSAPPAMMAATSEPEAPKIFRTVDSRGVVHFSNIEPPN
jgi:soluble lytic murein transglycosylase-like protein